MGIDASVKLTSFYQVPYMFPGAQVNSRSIIKEFPSNSIIFMCKKSTIFLPADTNLFKVITRDFEQTFACWIVTRQNLI